MFPLGDLMHRGAGPPLVLIPGIQGRWEWMTPAIDALARTHRVLTFSLTDATDRPAFDAWQATIDRLLDESGEARAVILGVSFGALAAVRYAARRRDRVDALVLVSPPAPGWRMDPRTASYARRPVATLPLVAWRTLRRLAPEVLATLPTWRARAVFAGRYGLRALRWPVSPRRMAAWALEWMETDLVTDCRQVAARTLVITGESSLDRVVAVSSSLEYLSLITGATHVTFRGTGHVGLVAKPREFAALVDGFLHAPAPGQRDRPADRLPFAAEPLGCG
jgi:pimeloyl-ACP methyl ester carboxylesterase